MPATVSPGIWKESAMNHCTLHWYRTDDGGFAMPLPDNGELVLRPMRHNWRTSGKICGVTIAEEVHPSLVDAFGSIERSMERDGGDILAAAFTEQQWTSTDATPLQAALLSNLLGTLEAEAVKDRDKAQMLIDRLYRCEYSPSARVKHGRGEEYSEKLMRRCGLDSAGIQESKDRDGGA
jgi:hypothetical protein